MLENSKLKRIEEELAGYVKIDRKNWTRIYLLMHEVEKDKLYREREDTQTFTSWVNYLADSMHVHVSLLWARLKAGRSYAEYEARAEQQGRTVTPLANLTVSPDSLNLCEKVAGKNATEMDKLIDKVVAGDLTRDDLRAAARARRAAGGTMPTTRHDRVSAEQRTEKADTVTAADIVMALRKSPEWLETARDDDFFEHKYRIFDEFRIPSGSSRSVRRIDAMVFETVTAAERDEIVIRGIEIKVSKSDLLRDHKMEEYTSFCDFFYIAIPEDDPEMLAAAESIRRPSWGVLTVSKEGGVTVVHEPEKLEPVFRDKTLANCILRLI